MLSWLRTWLRNRRDIRLLKMENDILRAQFEAYLDTLPEEERKREREEFEAELAAARKELEAERAAGRLQKDSE